MFGRKFATTQLQSALHAKGSASLLVGLCWVLPAHTGSWNHVFAAMIGLDLVEASLAAAWCLTTIARTGGVPGEPSRVSGRVSADRTRRITASGSPELI